MFGYIARRLVQLVFVLIGVSIITFLIMFLIPGDPAYLLAGKNATPQRVAEIRVELGLNKPIYVQYGRFVDRLAHGNFGESYQFERPVRADAAERHPQHRPARRRGGADRIAGHTPRGLFGLAPVHDLGQRADHDGADHLGYPRVRAGGLHAVLLRGLPGHPALLRHRRQHVPRGSSPPTGTTSRTSSCRP